MHLCSANYSMSLSLSLTQNECTKILSLREFFLKSFYLFYFFMNEGLCKKYTLLNKNSVSIITAMHKLIDSKIKIIKYYYLDKWAQSTYTKSPTQCPTHEYINSYIISFLSYVELSIFTTFNNIFK